jgi:thiol-disulfide isomerase/thioredoxin
MQSKLSPLLGRICLIIGFTFAGAVQADGVPREAPDFSAPDMSGVVQTLSSYRGRIVVLNFWATWCPECVREIPSLNAFADANKDIVVLGVASERDPEAVRHFIASSTIKYPTIVDSTGDLFVRKYMIRALPSTIIVDRKGFIAGWIVGAENFQSAGFRDRIQRLKEVK